MSASTLSGSDRELGSTLAPKFDSNGLITAVAVDADSHEVLMVAFMNKEALERTLNTGNATYWSRSRQKFWVKGEESGHTQKVQGVYVDCDQDCVVVKVKQLGAACHNGFRNCFYRQIVKGPDGSPGLQTIAKPEVDMSSLHKKK